MGRGSGSGWRWRWERRRRRSDPQSGGAARQLRSFQVTLLIRLQRPKLKPARHTSWFEGRSPQPLLHRLDEPPDVRQRRLEQPAAAGCAAVPLGRWRLSVHPGPGSRCKIGGGDHGSAAKTRWRHGERTGEGRQLPGGCASSDALRSAPAGTHGHAASCLACPSQAMPHP